MNAGLSTVSTDLSTGKCAARPQFPDFSTEQSGSFRADSVGFYARGSSFDCMRPRSILSTAAREISTANPLLNTRKRPLHSFSHRLWKNKGRFVRSIRLIKVVMDSRICKCIKLTMKRGCAASRRANGSISYSNVSMTYSFGSALKPAV